VKNMAVIIGTTKYFSAEEVAEILHLNPITVRNKMRMGQLPGHKFGGRWYISEEQLAQAFAAGDQQTKPAAGE